MESPENTKSDATMVQVTFVQPNGHAQHYAARVGDTLLDVALDNAVPGIVGQCGGGCRCCTCHCWIDQPWLARLPAPHQDELDLLVYAWGFNSASRLACQVPLTKVLDGLCVHVPAQQS